jgi:hypothetical protein
MKIFTSTLLLVLFHFIGIHQAFAQPENDDVCNALAIIIDGGIVAVDNTGATVQTDEVAPPVEGIGDPCVTAWCAEEAEVQNSIWFTFIAPESGAVEINTCVDTNEVDTQLAVWQTADCNNFSAFEFLIANDDVDGGCDNSNPYSSYLFIDGLTAGETYYLQIDGYDGEEGVNGIEITTAVPSSKVNFIHNSGDATIEVVDIRINGQLYADDLAFQTCTGYIDIPADTPSSITINASDSNDDSNPYLTVDYTLNSSENYVMTISGIQAETGYTPAQPLSIDIFEGALLYSNPPGTVNVLFHHGVTDAPTVDLVNGETMEALVNDLAYGSYNSGGYVVNNGETFSLMVTDEDGNDLGLNYCVPLTGISDFDLAFTVVISGFVTPSNNSDGPAASVYFVNHFNGTFEPLQPGLCAFPENDDICNALNLIVNDPPTLVNNSLASVEENESSTTNLGGNDPESDCLFAWCDGSLENTLWFTFTAPSSGAVMVSTCFETTIDTQVSVCEVGSCNDFGTVTYLGANDDMEGGCDVGNQYASELVVTGLTPGNTYYIHTDGWQGEVGEFQIQVTESTVNVSETTSNKPKLYPNPATDLLYIAGDTEASEIEIRDLQGKLLISQKLINGRTISLNILSAGVYTVSLKNDLQVLTEKLIKQ